MSDSLLDQLQQTADAALKSETVQEGIQHLAKAFSLFSKETDRLKTAYANLQQDFQAVNLELEKKNVELLGKIGQLDSMSRYVNNILKNISQGIIFINLEGKISTFNKAASKILEIPSSRVSGKRFWNHFPDDFFGFSLKDALHFGLSERLSYRTLQTPQKQIKEVEISVNFVFEGPKAYQGIIILLRDITHMQRLHLIANRNDRMKELGEMAATVAHEIRNPLGGIRGYATLLHRDLEGSEHMQEMANYIIEGTKTLERLVSTVLHYARPIQLQISSTDMAALLKEVCKFIKVDSSFSDDVKVLLHISEQPLYVPIDRDLIRSALLNLIVNAFQAMKNLGELTFSLIKQNQQCILSITDTGLGIEGKDLENIFSPFFTTKEGGNGLGLSETYKIIQAHFGTIDVYSQPGKGTTFTITLPLKKGRSYAD